MQSNTFKKVDKILKNTCWNKFVSAVKKKKMKEANFWLDQILILQNNSYK